MATKTGRPEMSWIESRQEYRKRKKIGGKSYDIYGKTKAEVRKQVKDLEEQQAAGLVLDDQTHLPEYVVLWIKNRVAGLGPSAQKDYQTAVNKHIVPVLGDILLRDVKPSHIAQIMANCSTLSHRMQSRILGTMNQIMNAAVADGLIYRNPCVGIKAGGAKAKEKTPLTRDQQAKLLEAARGEYLYLFVLLCLYAGLRREEALGLIWEHVHLKDVPYIDIRNTLTYAGNPSGKFSDRLKTPAARRSIPLPDILANALRNVPRRGDKDFVIPAISGKALPDASYKRYWQKIHSKVKDDFTVHPHLLRHTYITELCASGMDIKKIQYLAGHSDPRMTLKIYTHVTQNRPHELLSAVQGAFNLPTVGGQIGGQRRYKIVRNISKDKKLEEPYNKKNP